MDASKLRELFDPIYPYQEEQLSEPNWDEYDRVHNWRNYIPKALREHWHELSEDARLVAFYMAESRASSEDWE